jgi:hypothetical protein
MCTLTSIFRSYIGINVKHRPLKYILRSDDKVIKDKMDRAFSTNGEKWNSYMILMGRPEGKRPLVRPRPGCVDSIKMDLREIVWGGVNWIDLAQDRDQ